MDAFFRRSKCMTKAELVEKVADKIQLTKKQTEAVVNILLNCITEALSEEDKVELRGFGSFRIRNRNPREGCNPKTGGTVQIPAKRVPFFKAGKELRDMVGLDHGIGHFMLFEVDAKAQVPVPLRP